MIGLNLGFRIEERAEGGHRVIEDLGDVVASRLATPEEVAMWERLLLAEAVAEAADEYLDGLLDQWRKENPSMEFERRDV